MALKVWLAAAAALSMTSCTNWFFGRFYDATDTGELKGKIIVEWLDPDRFIFEPDPNEPLTFRRKDNEVIQPQRMYTDGGSIPPALRAIKSYSPWGYAPAFIVHDWLFVMKQCKIPGFEKYDLEKAATIMAEIMKTLMKDPRFGGENKLALYSMHEGVVSKTARDYWDNGSCDTPTGPRSMAGPTEARSARSMPRADTANTRLRVEFSF